MKPQIKEIEQITAIGMEVVFISMASPDFNGTEIITPLWQNFNARRSEIKNLAGNRSFGVTFPFWQGKTKKEHEMVYVACVEVENKDSVPQDMLAIDVPKGKYAVFTHKGKVDKIYEMFKNIYSIWMPQAGLAMRDAPHLEIYDERFIWDSENSEFDICVPVV